MLELSQSSVIVLYIVPTCAAMIRGSRDQNVPKFRKKVYLRDAGETKTFVST